MKVLLVSTWQTACGIAEHAAYLKEAVEAADPSIELLPHPGALNPVEVIQRENWVTDRDHLVHLNYHAALHSRWTPDAIRQVQALGLKVLVTYHDTGVPNSDQCKAVIDAADAAVVHEPFDDLPAEKTRYWRMGVPDWTAPTRASWCGGRPVLGTIGFPFPWKHYDQLARVTAEAGWAFLVVAPSCTLEQQILWHELNPYTRVVPEFIARGDALSLLAGCDATAFSYVCHNTGQSGAILQGIAARKPVIALKTCRQFRALHEDQLGHYAIRWCETFEGIAMHLYTIPIQRVDPFTVALAEQDSWAKLGAKYAALYRSLA